MMMQDSPSFVVIMFYAQSTLKQGTDDILHFFAFQVHKSYAILVYILR